MASFKLNVGRVSSCPPPAEMAAKMQAFGLPKSEEFGVLNVSSTEESVFGTIARKTQQAVQRLDPETGQVTSEAVEKVALYPFGVKPSAEILEVYAGPAGAIEQVGLFFSGCLALPTVVENIELDVASAVAKLSSSTQRFQLRSVRVKEYAANSYMAGPYAPKFLDTQHGVDFMEEYAEYVTTAGVRFQGPTGRVTVNLTPKASFGYSCAEDDQPTVQIILRKLL